MLTLQRYPFLQSVKGMGQGMDVWMNGLDG